METLEQPEASSLVPDQPVPKVRWTQILAISIFWFALNFHWAALGIIILPSQVLMLVGQAHKGEALAFVLIPGAFVSLIANPLFGWLSDQTHGRLAAWGRRRPYILFGTLINIGALLWMASAHDILSLAIAYILVQFSSNAAQAPFHALLPDIVAEEQRGLVSGVMGILMITGNIAGATVAGLFIEPSLSPAIYQQHQWITYGSIIVIMFVFMLITVCAIPDRSVLLAHVHEPYLSITPNSRPSWLKRSLLITIGGTLVATLSIWGLLFAWNSLHPGNILISADWQQVILEVVITFGILRLFDFHPRRDPDFAWVLLTRFLMMMGITTIQGFVQYYLHDVIGVSDPGLETAKFLIIAALTSLVSAFFAGWLSDRFGRKRIIYVSGGMMALLGLLVVVSQILFHSTGMLLTIIFVSGGLFGLGYGAYQSVDWALVADTLPTRKHYARDMGVWNISLSLPQVIAPVIAGPLIDIFVQRGMPATGYQLLFSMAILYCVLGTVTVRNIRVK